MERRDYVQEAKERDASARKPAYTLMSGRELRELDIPKTMWMSHMLIPHPGLVAISGQPGAHKTFFALWLGMRIADGRKLFDELDEPFFATASMPAEPPKANVLFIEEENNVAIVKERFTSLTPMEDEERIAFMVEDGFKFTNDAWRAELATIIRERNIKVLIMDSFVSVMGIKNENDNAEIAGVLDIVRHEFVKLGLTIIFIHHPAKSNEGGTNLRGAGDILGKMDVHLCLTKDQEDKRKVLVSYEKMRVADETLMSNFRIRLSGENELRTLHYRYIGQAKPKHEEARDKLADEIMEALKDVDGEFTQKDVAEYVRQKSNNKKFVKTWDSLVEKRWISQNVMTKRWYKSSSTSQK